MTVRPWPPRGDLVVRRAGRVLPMTRPADLGLVEQGAVVVTGGRVEWVGPERDLPAGLGHRPELDAGGAVVVPGFVDAHTHLPWAGSRRADFEARLAGVPYVEILERGGGIHSTVRATRAASDTELASLTTTRAWELLRHGTTTAEVKSGYGLTVPDELRLLAAIEEVAATVPLRVEPTYLGAHAVPPDRDRREYVEEVVATLPLAAAHARWCDVFCDRGAFTVAETREILLAARAAGLGLRVHAEELDHTGGAALAAELGCASADHLGWVDEADAKALAAAGTAAVLLPATTLSLRSDHHAPARMLLDAGVTVALGTDCNPGTSWCESMPFVLQLACLVLGLSVAEAFWAATRGSAYALRRSDVGSLSPGTWGDLAVLAAEHEADLVAHLGARAVAHTVVGGMVVGHG